MHEIKCIFLPPCDRLGIPIPLIFFVEVYFALYYDVFIFYAIYAPNRFTKAWNRSLRHWSWFSRLFSFVCCDMMMDEGESGSDESEEISIGLGCCTNKEVEAWPRCEWVTKGGLKDGLRDLLLNMHRWSRWEVECDGPNQDTQKFWMTIEVWGGWYPLVKK